MAPQSKINLDSRVTIHYGINYVAVSAPVFDAHGAIEFQKNLAAKAIDLPSVNRVESEIQLLRQAPHLHVLVKAVGPQVCQLLVTSDSPGPLPVFQKEAEAICKAYETTWGTPVQFLNRDAAIHSLFSLELCKHSFEYVWERLLEQGPEDTRLLGHPIFCGGLRFVMPPIAEGKPEPTSREVTIESFMAEPAKLFVATHLSWPEPAKENMFAKCVELLDRVEKYMSTEVVGFLTHKETGK